MNHVNKEHTPTPPYDNGHRFIEKGSWNQFSGFSFREFYPFLEAQFGYKFPTFSHTIQKVPTKYSQLGFPTFSNDTFPKFNISPLKAMKTTFPLGFGNLSGANCQLNFGFWYHKKIPRKYNYKLGLQIKIP